VGARERGDHVTEFADVLNHVESVALGSNLLREFRCRGCGWKELENLKDLGF
jgi:hypothetical protein